MDYVLTASVFHHRADGRRRRFERGDRLTGLSDRDVRRLLAAGAIAPVKDDAPAQAPAALPESQAPAPVKAETGPDQPRRPKQTAPKPVWVDYAVAKGFDRAEAESMTKPDLIQALG